MDKFHIPVWKSAPVIRLVIPFISGILIYYYFHPKAASVNTVLIASGFALLLFSFLTFKWQFTFQYINGLLLNFLLLAAGSWLTGQKDPFKNLEAAENLIPRASYYVATIEEPLLEKQATWKAMSSLERVICGGKQFFPNTNLFIYFRKESSLPDLAYGSRIFFRKRPDRINNFIQNSAFNYQQYCSLKNIHHQVFLNPGDFLLLEEKERNRFYEFLFNARCWVVSILQDNIAGKKESGLAEALLIGYKNDLDKTLMQSYSNTGVIHVVAISGLHLGLIFCILNFVCSTTGKSLPGRLIRMILILSGLWVFSLLAGGSPSVLRSAVMFSSIVIGDTVSKRSSILNNLAASAFFLLWYDPYWLWDPGFILSYSALLSIVIFMKPLYNLIIVENRILDATWKLNAVTVSAQILTMPILLYYFRQFPNLFILTNFIAVPLSGVILSGGILLCTLYFINPVANFIGHLLTMLIRFMNMTVEMIDKLPYSSMKGLNISFIQVLILYVIIAMTAYLFIGKHNHGNKFHLK